MNEQKQTEWRLVPVEPTAEIIAAAAVAAWPVAKPADIELARHAARYVLMQMDLGTGATEESLAAVLATMAPAYRAMVAAAAPRVPGWSSCTEPGPDGYQRTVQVPGMPGAARDAAQIDVEFKRLADAILQAPTNHTRNEALRDMAELFDRATATPGPVQQAPIGIVATYNRGGTGERNGIEPIGKAHCSLAEELEAGTLVYAAPVQQAAPSDWSVFGF